MDFELKTNALAPIKAASFYCNESDGFVPRNDRYSGKREMAPNYLLENSLILLF